MFAGLRRVLRERLEQRWQVPSPQWRLHNLAQRGFQADHIVDVGAYHGEFSVLARQCFPQARLSVVEGSPQALTTLAPLVAQWPHATLHRVLAGAGTATVPFLSQHSNSRIVSEQFAATQPADSVQRVDVRALDDILVDADVDLLKIDVQGHELAVLQGATQTLRKTRAVLVEVSILPIGDAQPWTEVLRVLTDAGFVLMDLIEPKYRPRDGALWQIDLLLLRSGQAQVTDRSW